MLIHPDYPSTFCYVRPRELFLQYISWQGFVIIEQTRFDKNPLKGVQNSGWWQLVSLTRRKLIQNCGTGCHINVRRPKSFPIAGSDTYNRNCQSSHVVRRWWNWLWFYTKNSAFWIALLIIIVSYMWIKILNKLWIWRSSASRANG